MVTKRNFFAYIQRRYSVTLEDHAFWESFTTRPEFNFEYADIWLHDFLKFYARYVKKDPDIAPMMDNFFSGIFQKKLLDAQHDVWATQGVENIFHSWTQCGTYPVSNVYLEPLMPMFKYMIEGKANQQCSTARMIASSTVLWGMLKKPFLDLMFQGSQYLAGDISFQLALHRHAPKRASKIQWIKPDQMYKIMCGADINVKPSIAAMHNVLTGPHNNALAWHTALAVCAPHDPTIVGSWLKMLEPFSTLRLDPKDPNAWKFWHSLSECCTSEASGRNLILFLSQRQQEMSQAFNKNWSMVETLFEGVERCERAAQMHQLHQHVELALPTMCSEEHLLQ